MKLSCSSLVGEVGLRSLASAAREVNKGERGWSARGSGGALGGSGDNPEEGDSSGDLTVANLKEPAVMEILA